MLKKIYKKIKNKIEERLKEFKDISGRKRVFAELAFCILTPQSKAKVCWNAVKTLIKEGLLLNGSAKEVERHLKGVRFKHKKARYIVEARRCRIRTNGNPFELRDLLVREIKGIGYKEASHFLRNIGLGENLAILDRHILKNLKEIGVIKEVPKTLSRKKYLEIEKKFRKFSRKIGIPLSHLDLLLWYKETGEVFK